MHIEAFNLLMGHPSMNLHKVDISPHRNSVFVQGIRVPYHRNENPIRRKREKKRHAPTHTSESKSEYSSILSAKDIKDRLKNNHVVNVHVNTNVNLPAQATTRIRVSSRYWKKINTTKTFITLPDTEQVKGLSITPGMYSVRSNNKPYIEVKNLRGHNLFLKKGTHLCDVEMYSNQILTVSEITNEQTVALLSSNEADKNAVLKAMNKTDFPEATDRLVDLLTEFRSCIALDNEPLGCTHLLKHHINVPPNLQPIYVPAYRIPHALKSVVDESVDKMLKDKIITPSDSPYNFPIILVPKKDGNWRLVVDFRKLNDVTIPDRFPTHDMRTLLSSLGGNKYFSTLDLLNGFLQIPLDSESIPLTAFSTDKGHYAYTRMPFGLKSSPITFTRLINTIFSDIKEEVDAYMDDLIIKSPTLEDHLRKLRLVFTRLRDANLKIKIGKCSLLKKELSYLGHRITEHGLQVTNEKIKDIINYPRPTNLKEVKAFLGLAGFYRSFVPNFASKASPLTFLTKKDIPFIWGDSQSNAFNQLKQDLTTPPVLAYPDYSREFYLATDASDQGIGSALMQQDDRKKLQPIAFYSRKFRTKAEQIMSTFDKEGLAIIESLKHFRHIIYKYRIIVLTDNYASTVPFKDPLVSGKRARWFVTASDYDLTIRFIPGKTNAVADCLSRMPSEANIVLIKEVDWSPELVEREQDLDPILGPIKSYLKLPAGLRQPAKFDLNINDLFLQNNLLMRNADWPTKNSPNRKVVQIVVPASLIPQVLNIVHDKRERSHPGKERSITQAKINYFWPSMVKDITHYVDACHTCAQTKSKAITPAPILNFPVPSYPYQRVSMDLLTNLSETFRGNKYVMVVIDHLTRFCELIPLTNKRAETVSLAFFDNILCRYCSPEILISDNGREFTNAFMKNLCTKYNTRNIYITPYHPSSNGVSERAIRKLLDVLRVNIGSNDPNWDLHIPSAQMCINTSYHKSIGETPHKALYGFEPRFPYEIPTSPISPVYNEDPIEIRVRNAQIMFNKLGKALESSKVTMVKSKNKRAKEHSYKINDKVYLRNPTRSGLNYKLDSTYTGPYLITRIIQNRVTLQLIADKKIVKEAHSDQLKLHKTHPMQLRPKT